MKILAKDDYDDTETELSWLIHTLFILDKVFFQPSLEESPLALTHYMATHKTIYVDMLTGVFKEIIKENKMSPIHNC